MFTGLVEEIGKVKEIQRTSQYGRFIIDAKLILKDIKIGDSIAVNGTCLTAVEFNHSNFTAEAMSETLNLTTLGLLKTGALVNLERALLPTTRLGGHFVSGHIDGMGTIEKVSPDGPAKRLRFSTSRALLDQMIPKGSIAIDGISLTLIEVDSTGFSVGIIPHTQNASTITKLSVGTKVNLETDILAKYCQKMLRNDKEEQPDALKKWAEWGF